MAIINGKDVRFVADLPEYLEQWDYELNPGIDPATVPVRSMKKRWFRCPKCGHTKYMSPYAKTVRYDVSGCQACDGKVVNNFDQRNSFGKVYPDLVQFWDYEQNKDTPYDVPHGSNKKRWFRCRRCGNVRKLPVYVFPTRAGCEKCMRLINTSFGESAVAYYLKKCGFDIVQNDRTTLGGLEIDILIPSIKLAIEYDGSTWHHGHEDVMRRKYEECRNRGYTLFRICEENSRYPLDVSKFCDWSTTHNNKEKDIGLSTSITNLLLKLGKIYDVSVRRDGANIELYRNCHFYEKSVAANAKMLELWDFDNNIVSPESVSMKGNVKHWFKCPRCGKSWHTDPQHVQYAIDHSGGCAKCRQQGRNQFPIIEMDPTGTVVVRRWSNIWEIVKETNFHRQLVCKAARGKATGLGGHMAYGRFWVYDR